MARVVLDASTQQATARQTCGVRVEAAQSTAEEEEEEEVDEL